MGDNEQQKLANEIYKRLKNKKSSKPSKGRKFIVLVWRKFKHESQKYEKI